MKLMTSILIALIFSTLIYPTRLEAQSVFENDFFIQPYIGGPNMKKWAFDVNSFNYDNSSGSAHFGLITEYVVSSNFSVGIDAIFSPLSWRETISILDYDVDNNQNIKETNDYVFIENKLRVIIRAYYHFDIANPLWNVYFSGGLGPNIIFSHVKVNGELKDSDPNVSSSNYFPIMNPPFPLSGRVCFGTRYFFSDFLGINFEAGIGGPLFAFGFNARF